MTKWWVLAQVALGILIGLLLTIDDCRVLNNGQFCKRIALWGDYEAMVANLTRKEQ